MDTELAIHEVLDREFSCDCSDTAIRYKLDSLGRKQYASQCLTCGRQVGAFLPYARAPKSAKPFDQTLDVKWRKRRQIRGNEIRAERQEAQRKEWFERYTVYLATPEWQAKRLAVLKRDGYRCQACLSCCTGQAGQIHHLSYQNVFNEPLFDLVAVCTPCHDHLHNGHNDHE